jgi:hypothetical protein
VLRLPQVLRLPPLKPVNLGFVVEIPEKNADIVVLGFLLVFTMYVFLLTGFVPVLR